jgi:hypothetical protein
MLADNSFVSSPILRSGLSVKRGTNVLRKASPTASVKTTALVSLAEVATTKSPMADVAAPATRKSPRLLKESASMLGDVQPTDLPAVPPSAGSSSGDVQPTDLPAVPPSAGLSSITDASSTSRPTLIFGGLLASEFAALRKYVDEEAQARVLCRAKRIVSVKEVEFAGVLRQTINLLPLQTAVLDAKPQVRRSFKNTSKINRSILDSAEELSRNKKHVQGIWKTISKALKLHFEEDATNEQVCQRHRHLVALKERRANGDDTASRLALDSDDDDDDDDEEDGEYSRSGRSANSGAPRKRAKTCKAVAGDLQAEEADENA